MVLGDAPFLSSACTNGSWFGLYGVMALYRFPDMERQRQGRGVPQDSSLLASTGLALWTVTVLLCFAATDWKESNILYYFSYFTTIQASRCNDRRENAKPQTRLKSGKTLLPVERRGPSFTLPGAEPPSSHNTQGLIFNGCKNRLALFKLLCRSLRGKPGPKGRKETSVQWEGLPPPRPRLRNASAPVLRALETRQPGPNCNGV